MVYRPQAVKSEHLRRPCLVAKVSYLAILLPARMSVSTAIVKMLWRPLYTSYVNPCALFRALLVYVVRLIFAVAAQYDR